MTEHVKARKGIVPTQGTQNKNCWKTLSIFAPRPHPPITLLWSLIQTSLRSISDGSSMGILLLILSCNFFLLLGSLTLLFLGYLLSSIAFLCITLGVLLSLLTLTIHIAHDLPSLQVLVCILLMNLSITTYVMKIPISPSLGRLLPLVLNLCHLTIDWTLHSNVSLVTHFQYGQYWTPYLSSPVLLYHSQSSVFYFRFLKWNHHSLITQIESVVIILSIIYFPHSSHIISK